MDDGQREIQGVPQYVLEHQSREVSVKRGQALYNDLDKRSNTSIVTDGGSKSSTSLLQCQIQMEDMISNKAVPYQPQLIYLTSNNDNWAEFNVRDFKDAQKTLISFCIQVPPPKSSSDLQSMDKTPRVPKESIFKNSRLMLHEIVDSDGEDEMLSALDSLAQTNTTGSQTRKKIEEMKENQLKKDDEDGKV